MDKRQTGFIAVIAFLLLQFCAFSLNGQDYKLEGRLGYERMFMPDYRTIRMHSFNSAVQYHIDDIFSAGISFVDAMAGTWPGMQGPDTPFQRVNRQLDFLLQTRFVQDKFINVGIGLGPSYRHRYEYYSIAVFPGYSKKYNDWGFHISLWYTAYLLKHLSVSAEIRERLYKTGPTSFSVIGFIGYRFIKSKS